MVVPPSIWTRRSGVCQGIFRATGTQKKGAIINLVGLWMVSTPCAFALAYYTSLKVRGLWVGMTIGYSTIAVLSGFYLCRLDWNELAQQAISRSLQETQEGALVEREQK